MKFRTDTHTDKDKDPRPKIASHRTPVGAKSKFKELCTSYNVNIVMI